MAPNRGGRLASWAPPLLLASALLLLVSSAKAGRLDAQVWAHRCEVLVLGLREPQAAGKH